MLTAVAWALGLFAAVWAISLLAAVALAVWAMWVGRARP